MSSTSHNLPEQVELEDYAEEFAWWSETSRRIAQETFASQREAVINGENALNEE